MENRLRDEKGDIAGSLGFGLFKMWVGTLATNDLVCISAIVDGVSG